MSDPLDPVVRAAQRLEAARTELQTAVDEARAAGASWAEVGGVLGTSRQAAFKRFGRPRDPRTGGAMTRRRSTEHVPALIEHVFRSIDRGDYAAVRARMPDEVAAVLTETAVLGAWAQVVGEIGNLEGCVGTTVDGAHDEGVTGIVVGDTTLRCEVGEVRGRVALDEADRVVGILVVPLDAADLVF